MLKSYSLKTDILRLRVRKAFFIVLLLTAAAGLLCGCGAAVTDRRLSGSSAAGTVSGSGAVGAAGTVSGSDAAGTISGNDAAGTAGAVSGSDAAGTGAASSEESSEAQKAETEPSPVCGVCIASDKAAYQVRLYQIMQKQAGEKGIRLIWKYADWDASLQNRQIQELIEDEVDVLIICPVNSKSMLDSLKEARSREIPVINLNMKVDAYSAVYIDTYVGASSQEEGRLAAELAAELLPDGGKAAILEGTPGTDPQIYRTQAFVDELGDRPDIQIADIRNADWNRQEAESETRELMQKIPDLRLIYCQDNNMAAGAVAAIQEAGKEKDIQVIGIGEADQETMDLLRKGCLKGFIVQDPEFEAKSAVNCAVHLAAGGNVRPWIQNPVSIVTEENAAEYRKPIEYV